MRDLIVLILFLATIAGVWVWLSDRMKRGGRGWFIRNFAGSSAGIFAGLLVVAIAVETGIIKAKDDQDTEQPQITTQAQVAAETSEPLRPVVQEAPASVEKASDTPQKTLGMTYQSYSKRLNAVLASLDKKYKVTDADFSKGEVNDVWQAKLGKYVAVVATVSKQTGEVVDLVAIGSGDGTPASGLEIMTMASAALTAATTDVEFREVFQGLPAMLKGQARSYGNVKLSVNSTQEMGHWFVASPI